MSNLVPTTELTPEQIALIKSTICRNASDDEMKLFLYRCKSMGLDPLKPGMIHFVKYGSGPGTIVVGIEGFRSKAAATGLHTGTKRGVIRNEKSSVIGAWCEIYRKDWQYPARVEVDLKEFDSGKGQWQKMPGAMIQKVAEVHALRMAFPDQLGGIYSQDEMDQAQPVKEVMPELPTAVDLVTKQWPKPVSPVIQEIQALQEKLEAQGKGRPNPGEYVVTFGKYKNNPIKDIDAADLINYMEYITGTALREGREIKGEVKDFIENAEFYLQSMENTITDEDLKF